MPSIYEGVSMKCRPIDHSEYDSYLIDYGKDVVSVLTWLFGLS